jgi:inner membrane protein
MLLNLLQNVLRSKPGSLGIVALLLLIPLALIESKIRERADFHQFAVAEISNSWTGPQTIMGPVVVVEYEVSVLDTKWSDKDDRYHTRTRYVPQVLMMPLEALNVEIDVSTQKRYRGIHEVQVFSATANMNGEYQPEQLLGVLNKQNFHRINSTYLWISVSDQRGFADIPTLTWGNNSYRFTAGGHAHLQSRGIKAPLPTDMLMEATTFGSQFALRGTSTLSFIPTGRTSSYQVSSDWPHPNFNGQYLPATRTINDGFSATWLVTDLATNVSRDLLACSSADCNALMANTFGVALIEPVDVYLMTERAVKYALLFVGLAFALVVTAEISRSVEVHPIQYLMVGVALSIFYLLLIALSEHLAFNLAYLVATLMCSSLLTYYGISIFNSTTIGFGFGGAITMLFGLLYVVLNTEDIALLLGTLLTFSVVTALMVVTRNSENLKVFSRNLWGTHMEPVEPEAAS